MEIVFATNNAHKLSEIRAILGEDFRILSLADIGCHDDIPETADTLEGNALIKARWVKERYGFDCFADDTGLEVEALGGGPGVHTARYAYPDRIITQRTQVRRDTLDGMREAVVDLWCLAATQRIIGSYWSSFTDTAAELRQIPLEIVQE